MDYLVVSTSVTDRIALADGTFVGEFLGGAGTYATCGIRLWCDDVLLVTGVGEDFSARHGEWFRKNNLPTHGLLVKDPYTAVSEVCYHADGERKETPFFGPRHYRRLEASPEEIGRFCKGAKGVYLFKDADLEYWNKMIALKKEYGFTLLWEINADFAAPEYLDTVRRIAGEADVFSINRTEARSMLSAETLDECAERLAEWNLPMIYLRAGAEGARILAEGKRYDIPAAGRKNAVDPTGGGNSASAAVLYAYCEGLDPMTCGIMGSISAAFCIGQYGPPLIDGEARAKALAMREGLQKEKESALNAEQ